MAKAKLTFNNEMCKGCEICVAACPKKILELDESVINEKGYHPAHVINIAECIACASCAIMCPDAVITVEKE